MRQPTQIDIALDALKQGKVLDQLNMLFDYGIGNHTAVITEVRRRLYDEGKGEEVITEWRNARSRKTGRAIRYATYYIPTRRRQRFFDRVRRKLGFE